MPGLKILYVQQIQLKWDYYLPFNRGVKKLLCVVDLFTKCAWVKPLKRQNVKAVLHGFAEIVKQSKLQSKKLWVGQEENIKITICKNSETIITI